MPGQFEDLIPQKEALAPPPINADGAFGDLIPQSGMDQVKALAAQAKARTETRRQQETPAQPAGRFDDLLPGRRGLIKDIPLQVLGGIRDAGQSMLNLTERGASALEERFPLGSITFGPGGVGHQPGVIAGPQLPEVPEAETGAGSLTRGISQFATGLIPGFQGSKLLGVGSGVQKLAQVLGGSTKLAKGLGLFAGSEAAAQIADQVAFDPYAGRLSNLIQEFPALENPVTEYLAADPEDSEAEARFKVALEGLGLGAMIPGVISGARGVRRTLRGTSTTTRQAGRSAPRVSRPTVAQSANAQPDAFTRPRDLPPRAGNIHLEHLDTPDNVKAVIAETAEQFKGQIDEARRGVISEAQTRQLADDLAMAPEDLLKRQRGKAFNAEEALAARQLLADSATDLTEKAQKAVGGSDGDLLAFRQALSRHAGIQSQVSGITAEAGRALRQFRIAAKGAEREQAIKVAIDQLGGRENVEALASMVAKIDTPEGLAAFARQATKTRASDVLMEAWINALLSGPQTQAVNILSNTLVAAWTLPEHLLAAGIGAVRRGGNRVHAREIASRALGFVQGARDGLRLAAKTFLTEEPSDLLTKIDVPRHQAIPSLTLRKGVQKTRLGSIPIPLSGEIQLGGKQIRIPGRLLQAGDEFFKSIGYRMELNALALREGLAKGLRGQALAEHVRKVVQNPPEKLRLAAVDAARYQTFTRPLGNIGRGVQGIAANHPAVRLVVPFIRTPSNIAKFAVERSPFGLLMKEVRNNLAAGGATRDIQLARMAFGTAVGATVANLAAEGHITGAGPSDRTALSALRNTGWQPYSLKIGDQYVAFNRLEPLGMLFGVSADLSDIAGEVPDAELDKIAGMIVGSISKNITSKTYLRGISELIQAIEDPDRYGEQYIQQFAGTLIPTGVAQVARTQDPVLRDTQGVIERLKSRIPGFSQDLPARRNIWGEPIVLGGGIGPDLISPVYSSFDRHDKVSEEFARLDVRMGLPTKKIRGIELTPEQYSEYVELAGRTAKRILDTAVTNPAYEQLSDDDKRTLFEGTIKRTRDAARNQMLLRLSGSTSVSRSQ